MPSNVHQPVITSAPPRTTPFASTNTGEPLHYGTFIKRCQALGIDYGVTWTMTWTLTSMVQVAIGPDGGLAADMFGVVLALTFVVVYYAGFESSPGQATPGKRIVGLKVTDSLGRRISFGRALGRYLAKFLSIVLLGIGYLMASWTARHQALHDFVADTLVLEVGR